MITLVLLTASLTIIVPIIGWIATQQAANNHWDAIERYEKKFLELEAIVSSFEKKREAHKLTTNRK